MKEIFLYWFLNVVARSFNISRAGIFIMYINPNGYGAAENIATKVEVNR